MHSKSYKNPCFFLFAFKMSVSKPKHQHTDRALKEKIEILGKLDCGLKALDVCKRFDISQSMLSTRKKQRETKSGKWWMLAKYLTRSVTANPFFLKWRGPLHLWFCEMRSKLHTPPLINHCLFRSLHCEYFYHL